MKWQDFMTEYTTMDTNLAGDSLKFHAMLINIAGSILPSTYWSPNLQSRLPSSLAIFDVV